MKCPHCDKPISRVIRGRLAKRAEFLRKKGLSARDIQAIMNGEGHDVSTSTIIRYFREA